ncbi:hypothetical protein MID13_21610 [Vibrio gigantis]|uniref:hypothetical protein n=1 Tax=Vibrio gigantis TaxID=296199 RepID=UPI001BFD751E|nr:hypothetical protein [Vibrio gigantis]ULN66180.1 hypothetical protein MID13_21610 [Vibrio gigantis]
MKKKTLVIPAIVIATVCIPLSAFAKDRDNSIEAGVTFIGNQELATFGYSKELSNNIVVGGGFSLGTEAVDLEQSNSQDAWGLYSNIGYKFEIAEFDIIPKIGINYLNADVEFDDASLNGLNIDNVYGSIGTTVNWRMIGLTVDYGKINDSAMVPDGPNSTKPFEEDVVRVTASFNF